MPRAQHVLSLLAPLLLLPAAAPLPALEASVERVANRPFVAGESGNSGSGFLDATPDGRFLLLSTLATNLVEGLRDDNGALDLLVYDRETQSLDFITRSVLDPQQSALTRLAGFFPPVISDDGRFVAFLSGGLLHSLASPGDTAQLYLFDRQARTTTKVSHPPGNPLGHVNGTESFIRISADGRFLAYTNRVPGLIAGDTNAANDVFQYDRTTDVNTLVSHAGGAPGTPASGRSDLAGMSADGRYVLFASEAANVVAGFKDFNGSQEADLYLWDRDTGSSVLISRSSGSPLAGINGGLEAALMSADGSRVAFSTDAFNLVAGFIDGNGPETDFYIAERSTGTVQLVSGVSPTQSQNAKSWPSALSADGRYFFFGTQATDVIPGLVPAGDGGFGHYRFDTGTRATRLINHRAGEPNAVALGGAQWLTISAGGEMASFNSVATELVPGQVGGNRPAVAYDFPAGTAQLVSHLPGQPLSSEYGEPVAISADHGSAAFNSPAGSLSAGDNNDDYDAFLYDLGQQTAQRVTSAAENGLSSTIGTFDFLESIPAAGLFLFHASDLSAFMPGFVDGQGGRDPVLFDPRTGALSALVAPQGSTPGGESRATFAANGLDFLLRSNAANLDPGMTTDGNGAAADLYAGNRKKGILQLISSSASSPSISANQGVGEEIAFSANGRFVAYTTSATNAVAGVTDTNGVLDIVLHDRQLGTRVLVSHAASSPGQTANSASILVGLSQDGEVLVFASRASNLIAGFVDQNGAESFDYFIYRRSTDSTSLISRSAFSATHTGSFGASFGQLAAGGRYFAFASRSGNLVAGMTNNGANEDVFLYDTATGSNSLVSHRPGNPLHGIDAHAYPLRISADGRFILLRSTDTVLVAGATYPLWTTSTFLYDRLRQRTFLISHLPGHSLSALGGNNEGLAISDDGRFVAFASLEPNVLPGQTGQALEPVYNIYLADRATGERALLSRSLYGPQATGNGNSSTPVLGTAARHVLFLSTAANLSLHHTFGSHVYLADLTAGGSELFRDGFELGDTSQWSETVGLD
jgi:Tol biopolymer transport system component